MKHIAGLLLLLISFNSFAECDPSKDITKLDDGSYKYSKGCHIRVGELRDELDRKEVQITEYKKAIELKDLALTKSTQNTQLWMDTSLNLQGKMDTIQNQKTQNQYLAFGLGVLFSGLAVWGAGQLR